MSIFSAKGQMARELSVPVELTLSYSNEQSFIEERVMMKNHKMIQSLIIFEENRNTLSGEFIPDYLSTASPSDSMKISFPKIDVRRRKLSPYQAPSLIIPIN